MILKRTTGIPQQETAAVNPEGFQTFISHYELINTIIRQVY